MLTNLDPASEYTLANLARTQERIQRAQREVSSGLKVATPADAPDQIDALLQLRATRARNTQLQQNLSLAKTDAAAAEQVLGDAANLLDRVVTLGAQAVNSTTTADARKTMAVEIESLQRELVTSSATMAGGRYIFSGDQSLQPAYEIDLTSPSGVNRLFTPTATAMVEDPAGGNFRATLTANQIFDPRNADDTPAPENVFAALNNLRLALLNNDPTGVGDAVASVKVSAQYLQTQTAFYGTAQRRIDSAINYASRYDTQLQTQTSSIEEADLTTAVLEMTQANTQLQATLAARARLPRQSLFDYLG